MPAWRGNSHTKSPPSSKQQHRTHLQLVLDRGASQQYEVALDQLRNLSHLVVPVLQARLGFKVLLLPSTRRGGQRREKEGCVSGSLRWD